MDSLFEEALVFHLSDNHIIIGNDNSMVQEGNQKLVFTQFPEEFISHILSFTSSKDACRCSVFLDPSKMSSNHVEIEEMDGWSMSGMVVDRIDFRPKRGR
ncbi:hypothetical protein FEM48_Zijuj07G0071800 [Ziziphus jujuba var. spinosa]|uniref:Uncharacterized protein n=1 Tax=Ziziphus jujuba var. spinosa TaxID=714518 RepID=A0A978V378_ZIZJJ|nr:hypothetical protein FEM48_Zijuj07G0071800 [Ziziphus jujuba var. spinosa]